MRDIDEQQKRLDQGSQGSWVSEAPPQPIKVGSVWLGREDGDLVYVESTDGSIWNINFNSLDDEHEYANDTEGFLKQYAFVCDDKDFICLAFGIDSDRADDEIGSVAINELWKANCDGTVCKVIDIEVDDGVTWIVTENEDAVEADTLADFFKNYEFLSYGDRAGDEPAKEIKHGHYHKDTSAYDTMDIYAICKVWNVEPSGCTFAAVKKLLNGGERGSKSRLTDLQQAIESVERLIQLEFPEHVKK